MLQKTFIDLFAGTGGLSEGFVRKGFIPAAHVEMDKNACLTLKTRIAYHYLNANNRNEIYGEYLIGKISREELYKQVPRELLDTVINVEISESNLNMIFENIMKNLHKLGYEHVDIIVGGPPCQAYSLIGRARDPNGKKDDLRNYLYRLYMKFLEFFNPSLFVFENVPGLLSARNGKFLNDIMLLFNDAGYEFDYKIHNAYDFGVLQKRKRVIFIGWLKKLGLIYPDYERESNGYLVKDLLIDLPPLRPGERMQYGDYYVTSPTKYLKRYGLRNKNDLLIHHDTRPHNKRDLKIYKMAIETWQRERKRLKYTDIPREYRTHKNTRSFLDRYKVVANDLPYSHTVTAHIAKDGHYYIHPDIHQIRSLSVREAARLQSFPENYYFEGSRTSQFMQIGNAVPPLMAEKIAEKLRQMLK